MSLSVQKEQASFARVSPTPASDLPRVKAAAAPAVALAGGTEAGPDPRGITAMSQALNSFLSEINRGAPQAANTAGTLSQAGAAYQDMAGIDVPAADGASAVGVTANARLDEALSRLKDQFDGVFRTFQTAADLQSPAARDAVDRLSADAGKFVGRLMQTRDDIARAYESHQASVRLAAAAAPQGPAESSPAKSTDETSRLVTSGPQRDERPSLFSQWNARLHRHFEDL